MKAKCPNSDEHKRFLTIAHVSEEWIVDEAGEFVDRNAFLDVDEGPQVGNSWTCFTCGAEADVEGGDGGEDSEDDED